MTILLIGGGSGGHITPLLAVARELKQLKPDVKLVAVCERNAKFAHLYETEPAIDEIHQISAGKYRRYSGLTAKERLTDVGTLARNVRDVGRTTKGYFEARQLLQSLKPDAMLIKGGFVAVPVGKAASSLGIPYLTHDSDSTPGLANRLIAKKAALHATGMPAELYTYPQDRTVYTGIPISKVYKHITLSDKARYRESVGLTDCEQIIALTGGSQGGEQLNTDMVSISARLMQKYPKLGIIHISGQHHELDVRRKYNQELLADEQRRVVVKGFVTDLYRYTAAAEVVVTRAGANAVAELAVQGKAIVVVPGRLAGGHQNKNAEYLRNLGAAEVAAYGDSEALYEALVKLLNDEATRKSLEKNLHNLAKPDAAESLAKLTLGLAKKLA
jgi:UDP-N-acetylglucosamine--N-acetylmuramyl-(pentapeptide) pyrophosphoryl-undecaprenol N-acetylglucosamine transferase